MKLHTRIIGRSFKLILIGGLMLGSITTSLIAFSPSNANADSQLVPCNYNGSHHSGHPEYNCQFYQSSSPVVNHDGAKIGALHNGSNWVLCQQIGKVVHVGSSANNWWAMTVADNGSAGWVNAVYGSGGDNYRAFDNVPLCYNHGYANAYIGGYAPGVATTCLHRYGESGNASNGFCHGPSYNGADCVGTQFLNYHYIDPNGYYAVDCYIR